MPSHYYRRSWKTMRNLTMTEVLERLSPTTGPVKGPVTVSRAETEWVRKLYDLALENYESYPELYTVEEEETLQIAGVIIRGMT